MAGTGYAAVDLGAESGRVMVGRVAAGRVALEPVHRFPIRPVVLPDGVHWSLLSVFAHVLDGLRRAAASVPLHGVGIDAWGVDYALLDRQRRLLGTPFHYRDRRTEGMIGRAHERVSRQDLYAVTGIQTMPINTIFQLLAEEGTVALARAERIALIADLFGFWLTGELANESTAASTTGLLDARTGRWARDIINRLGLPIAPFSGDLVEPATTLGPVLAGLSDAAGGAAGVPVHAVAGHDTASAFVAAPLRGSHAAVLSAGTWSLLGVVLDRPILTPEASAHNLTNERGIDGTIRLLRNVMGLWLLQQCRDHWRTTGDAYDYDQLASLAAAASAEVPLFDPDHDGFLALGDMPARIAAACREHGQSAPRTAGEFARSILVSLTCKYRLVLEGIERVTGRAVDVLHLIGGGARNRLLCRLTADMLGRPVLVGPVEATALGNVLVQARATGDLGSWTEVREVAAATAAVEVFEPSEDRGDAQRTYDRFLSVTGLAADPSKTALA